MDLELEKAFEIEKSGDYKQALKAYQGLDEERLSTEDLIFLKRSIAACLFYLHEYNKAKEYYEVLLESEIISSEIKKEIETCLYLCFLYGGHPDKAEVYFLSAIETALSPIEKMWDYWYLGQCSFLQNDFEKMNSYYQQTVDLSEKFNTEKIVFFRAHLLVSQLLMNYENDFLDNLNVLKSYNDTSYGLLKVVSSIYYKSKGAKDWKELYFAGIQEAKNSNYIENIDLGKWLLKRDS